LELALDGTQMRANASRLGAPSHEFAQKFVVQLRREVQQLLTTEGADKAAVFDGMDTSNELARYKERLKPIAAVTADIEAHAQERCQREQDEYKVRKWRRQRARTQ
jgi:hypothetical protein